MPSKRTRILLISHTCQSATEGQPKAEALARFDDLELCVLVPDRWKHYGKPRRAAVPSNPAYRYEVGRVAWPWMGPAQFYLHWYPRLGRLLREFQPDVIDLWEEPWGLISAQTCWLRDRLLPETKIISETEQNLDKHLPPPFERFRRYTLSRADHVVGRSHEAVEIVRRKGYLGPATMVPNAVDAELFQPMDRAACRGELGLEANAFLVGYVGRLVEAKGLTDLVDALKDAPLHAQLVLAGDGPLRSALEQQARQLGLGGRVRFLGALPMPQLPRVMNSLDVLALPSRTTASWKEQFGRVLIEAQACGVPVLGSDSGAIPDVVGEAGRIVPERSPTALAAALHELANDPASRAVMGQRGRAAVEARYTWQRVAERMRAIYQEVSGIASATAGAVPGELSEAIPGGIPGAEPVLSTAAMPVGTNHE